MVNVRMKARVTQGDSPSGVVEVVKLAVAGAKLRGVALHLTIATTEPPEAIAVFDAPSARQGKAVAGVVASALLGMGYVVYPAGDELTTRVQSNDRELVESSASLEVIVPLGT